MGYRFQTLDHPSYFTLILETVDSGLFITSDIAKSSMSFALIYLDSLIGLVFDGSCVFSFPSFNNIGTSIILYSSCSVEWYQDFRFSLRLYLNLRNT